MTDKRAGITSIGGYVGTQEAWEEVAVKWEENLRYWRLDEFHLHDLVEKMGHEKGALCALNFGHIVRDSKLQAVGAALNDVDWSATKAPGDPEHYYACLGMLLDLLGQHVGLEHPGHDVAIVVDRDMRRRRCGVGRLCLE